MWQRRPGGVRWAVVEEVRGRPMFRYEEGQLYDPRVMEGPGDVLFRFPLAPAEVGEIITLRRDNWDRMGWSYADKLYNRGRKSPPYECRWRVFRNPWAAARYAEQLRKGMLE